MKKLIFIFYPILIILFVGFSYLFIDPGFFYLKSFFTNFYATQRTLVTILFVIFIVLQFVFYGIVLTLIKKQRISLKELLYLIAINSLLIFSYPAILSFDIFNYIATAKVAIFYHENPYIVMPINFVNDSILSFTRAANKVALYAPFWIILTTIPFILGFGNFLLITFNFKLLVAIFYFLTVWLIWRMTKNTLSTAFFALNPLVIIETFVSGHNDIIMIFLFLVSVYFLFRNQKSKSTLFFLLSFLIKYATGILIPLYVYASFRKVSKQTFLIIATILLYIIFFLSSFREEIYPWYFIWVLLPTTLLLGDNLITWLGFTFSFSLLLRYIPYMLLGTYTGPTPIIKIVLTFIPEFITCIIYFLRRYRLKI